jgi:hypothetical protein
MRNGMKSKTQRGDKMKRTIGFGLIILSIIIAILTSVAFSENQTAGKDNKGNINNLVVPKNQTNVSNVSAEVTNLTMTKNVSMNSSALNATALKNSTKVANPFSRVKGSLGTHPTEPSGGQAQPPTPTNSHPTGPS